MIFILVSALNILPIGAILLGGMVALYLANKSRLLVYNCAMDLLTIRERYLTQQISFKQDGIKFSLEVEKAQQLIKANRLQLAGARQRVLAELDSQLVEEV